MTLDTTVNSNKCIRGQHMICRKGNGFDDNHRIRIVLKREHFREVFASKKGKAVQKELIS